jgi:hypothetical protein
MQGLWSGALMVGWQRMCRSVGMIFLHLRGAGRG